MNEKTPLSEITIKAVVLGIVLSMVLAAANAYLGLFAGMTVSASIPAAVVSMGLLKLFKRSNILENNIVQTAASAGESLTGNWTRPKERSRLTIWGSARRWPRRSPIWKPKARSTRSYPS